MQLEVLHLEPCGVERADDLGELLRAAFEPDGNALGRAAGRLPEALEDAGDRGGVGAVAGNRLDGRAADLRLQRARCALGDDLAVVDDPDAIREDVGLFEVLRGEEDGHAVVLREAGDLLPERRSALRVEAGRRLVEEEDGGPVCEREREVEPALHAARVAVHLAVGGLGEADPAEQLVGPGRPLAAREAVERRLQPDVLAAGEEPVERRFLQGCADRGADLRPLLDDVVAGHARRAGGRRQQRRQHVHRRRLARRRSGRGSRRSRRARP